jgi:Bacterial membrane protein YfhO
VPACAGSGHDALRAPPESRLKGSRWGRHGLALAALLVMVCAFYAPQLVGGTVQFDGLDVHYSAQRYLSDELRAGRLPFWTPYIFAGFPFLADLQVGAWYPLNWPFFLAGITPTSISAELLLHSLIACGGAYALAMCVIGRAAASVAVAIFYGLSGWFAAHSQHVGMSQAAAWLPWLVLLFESIGERLSLRRLALAGLLGALLALPGHFQVALYAATGVGVWALLEAAVRRSAQRARRIGIGMATLAAWGGCLAAITVLPGLELVGQSVRTQLDVRDVNLGYFHPGALFTLIQPDHYGLLSGRYTGPADQTQHYFYAGIALLPLAALGLRNGHVARMALFLGVPFVWYAAGPAAGLFDLVVRLPGFSGVELPMHGWFLPALGLALLGGGGFAVAESRLKKPWLAALLGVLFVDVFTVNELLNPLAFARGSFDELYGGTLGSFQAQVAAAQPAVERLYGPPLAAVGYRNHALQSRTETTYGYNPLELASYADYAAAADSNPRLVDGFAATHRLTSAGAIDASASALPLAFFARHVIAVPDDRSARDRLTDLDPGRETLVVGAAPSAEPDPAVLVSVVERGGDHLSLQYRSASSNLLRVAIPWFPGWHASTPDGVELPVVAVDGAFIGVIVPAGQGELRLSYTSRWFVPGAVISGLALVAAIAALVRRPRLSRRAPRVARPVSHPAR